MQRASIQAAAAHYGVSARTIRRWIAEGRLHAVRVGPKLLRVDLDDTGRLEQPVRTAS